MSTAFPHPQITIGHAVHSAPIEIARTPFYLESGNSSLMAWLHVPTQQAPLTHGIVIAAPVGYEQLHSYRSLRHLADSLAARGFPVLRFDWHGTGDSLGSDHDPDRVKTWEQNLRDAIAWMRKTAGCRQISLVGLRIGASLAALAAQDSEIESLVCWAPIAKGRSFVREMQAIDLTGEARVTSTSSDTIEAGGFLLTANTADELTAIQLSENSLKCNRLLIVSNSGGTGDQRLEEQFRSKGLAVDFAVHPGLPEMLAEPHRSQIPHESIQNIADWFEQAATAQNDSLELKHSPLPASIKTTHFKETAVRISANPDLFGILCEPILPAPQRPTILLLNAGATTRIGPGRLYVELARRLAEAGFKSLRLDFQGLGDSIQPDLTLENDSYASTAFRDIQIAIDFLKAQYDTDRTVLMGLCSGAYAAFQAGAQLGDPSITESILINPLTYFWREGMTIDDDPGRHLIRQHYYLDAMRDPGKWFRFLTGRSRTSLRQALGMIAKRIELSLQPRPALPSSSFTNESAIPGHPARRDLPADLETIAARGRHLAMFFSESDPGYMILNHFAKRTARRLQSAGKLEFQFIPHADHTFSREAPRTVLIDSLIGHLNRRYPT